MSVISDTIAQYLEDESEEKALSVEVIKVEEGLENNKETVMVTVTDPQKGTGGGNVGVGGGGGLSSFLMSMKEKKWCKALLGVRISAFVFCLISFSVMAANMETVLVEQSVYSSYYQYLSYAFRWYDHPEFKYILSANVMGFVYSGMQICDLVKYLITKKHTIRPRLRGYLNVAMDQGLAYLLLSASSSAATTVHYYRSSWVELAAFKFAYMANTSVALSFLAFKAFALASFISGFILCRFT